MNYLLNTWATLKYQVLRIINRRRLLRASSSNDNFVRIPVFVIASPPDMHLAPLAVSCPIEKIKYIVLANGISNTDVDWIRSECPNVTVVQLRSSLSGNALTYLPHAEVIDLCYKISASDFIIQDADTFVTDPNWWRSISGDGCGHFARGPFGKEATSLGSKIPDTFLVRVNRVSYKARENAGIRPHITKRAPGFITESLRKRGIVFPYFPDAYHDYFDTLQLHWISALLKNEEFEHLPGENECVFHVGGTSYLTAKNNIDPYHWDYWPLNTVYFNMRVLESARFSKFRHRFAWIYETYGTADKILDDFPGFLQSRRYQNSERILSFYSGYLEPRSNETGAAGSLS